MTTEKGPSGSVKFECKMCEYSTSKQSQYDRHNLTAKHINATKCYKNTTIKDPKMYECNCGNKYKHHSSLWTHKKKCKEEEPKKGGLSNQIRHRSRSRDLEEAKNDPKHAQKHR